MLTFLLLQLILLSLLFIHDWFSIPYLVDLKNRAKYEPLSKRITQGIINTLFIGAAVILTAIYFSTKFSQDASQYIIIMYGTFFLGELYTWWLPYFFGVPKNQAKMLEDEYQNTLKILPKIQTHPTPDVMHMILHGFTLLCFITAWKLLV